MEEVTDAFLRWCLQFGIVSSCMLIAAHLLGRKMRAARRKKMSVAE